MAEDPIERTHKEDKNLGRTFSHIRNLKLREESKKNVIQMKSHGTIANIIQQKRTSRKMILKVKTEEKKKLKSEHQVAVKIESRKRERSFSL